MKDFRCKNQACHQLLFKYTIDGDVLTIQVKCYACNIFSSFTVYLNRVQYDDKISQPTKDLQ